MNFLEANIDEQKLERFRSYLKLLAHTQLDSQLGQRIDASDIVQQTLLDAVKQTDKFLGTSESEFLAWLRKILTHNLVDAFRFHGRAKRDMSRQCSLDDDISKSFRRLNARADTCASPSQRAATNEQLLALPQALDQLAPGQREAIILHHLQGLKLAETSKRMGKSEAAVCGLLHRGLKRLHELLGDRS